MLHLAYKTVIKKINPIKLFSIRLNYRLKSKPHNFIQTEHNMQAFLHNLTLWLLIIVAQLQPTVVQSAFLRQAQVQTIVLIHFKRNLTWRQGQFHCFVLVWLSTVDRKIFKLQGRNLLRIAHEHIAYLITIRIHKLWFEIGLNVMIERHNTSL